MNKSEMHKYSNIINLPRPVSKKHKPMPIEDRAAQFSSFAALTGYESMVSETARLTDSPAERDGDAEAVLNERMQLLSEWEYKYPTITVKYFIPDERKSGGAYVTVTGCFKWLDMGEGMLVMQDGTKIPFDDILRIDGKIFEIDDPMSDEPSSKNE